MQPFDGLPVVIADAAKGLLISCITLGCLIALFEGYLRQRHAGEHDRLVERYAGRDLCMRAATDRRLVYELTAGRCGANSEGFADAERAYAKQPGTFRMVLIGDSVAQGHGVRREERFGERLQALLSGSSPRPIEVVNLARGGYSTAQELIVLERWALRYEPDLILWSYVLNDPAHVLFHDANGEAGRYFDRPSWHGWRYVSRKVFEVRERWRARNCRAEFHELLHCAYRDEIEQNLAALGRVTQRAGVPVLLMVHPVLVQADSFDAYPHRKLHADLLNLAAQAGLPAVDLLEALDGANPAQLAQSSTDWFDPWHPNAAGHELIARYLALQLQAPAG